MYMQLQQHDQASNQFYSGLGLLAAGMYPGRNPKASMQWAQGMQQDPNSMFNSLVQIHQMNQQQASLDAFNRSIPDMMKQTGLTADEIRANPQAATELMGKIAATNAGISSDPTMQEMNRAKGVYMAQNGITDPHDPRIPDKFIYPEKYKATVQGDVTTAKTTSDDLVADQHNFPNVLQNYDKTLSAVDELMTPDMQKAAQEFLGRGGQTKIDFGALSDPAKHAYQLYKQIMASQFAAGTQDFKGAGRITQQELTQDAPSQSTMGINQSPKDFFDATATYRAQIAQHRAQLFGPAQKGNDPRLSDEDYARYVMPNLDLYGGPTRDIPDFSKMSAADADKAYEALPVGKVFIDTDGQPKHRRKD